MANEREVLRARVAFERQLNLRRQGARIAKELTRHYDGQIAKASAFDLERAASWAAQRLHEQFTPPELETQDVEKTVRALRDGCPLCA